MYKELPPNISIWNTVSRRIIFILLGVLLIGFGLDTIYLTYGTFLRSVTLFGILMVAFGIIVLIVRIRLEIQIIKYNQELISKKKSETNNNKGDKK